MCYTLILQRRSLDEFSDITRLTGGFSQPKRTTTIKYSLCHGFYGWFGFL